MNTEEMNTALELARKAKELLRPSLPTMDEARAGFNASGPGVVTGGENVKTLAEYSSDITDPLATAATELGVAILGVDEEKAWALGSNEERDLWISAVEMFMAAMLKWAQAADHRLVLLGSSPTHKPKKETQ